MQLMSATVSFAMQLTHEAAHAASRLKPLTNTTEEAPMRAISLIAPALLAETRYVELVPEQIARSVRISEEEILDDLLYPADHSAVGKPVAERRSRDSGSRS
jgi:hypothetical protein